MPLTKQNKSLIVSKTYPQGAR